MIRVGMTLIETLVALVLLSALSIAAVQFIQFAARHSGSLVKSREWEMSAHALLCQVHDDIVIGDVSTPGEPKVEVSESTIRVRTRSILPERVGSEVVYEFDAGERNVWRRVRADAGESPSLGEVSLFEASIDIEEAVLTVSLRSAGGVEVSRSVRLP